MGNSPKKPILVDMGVEVYEDCQTKIKYKKTLHPDAITCVMPDDKIHSKFARLPKSIKQKDLVGHMIPLSHSSVEEYFRKTLDDPNYEIISIQIFPDVFLD